MDKLDKLVTLDEFFQQKVWFLDFGPTIRLVGVTIKVEPTGYLAILRAITAEGPKVAFLGKKGLDKLRTALLDESGRDAIRWRDDKYKLDKKT